MSVSITSSNQIIEVSAFRWVLIDISKYKAPSNE